MWDLVEQLQAATSQTDRFAIGKSADSVVRRLLQIPCRPFILTSPLKVHRKLRRDFTGPLAIDLLAPFSDLSVQLHAPRCGQSLIQHVLIQRMNKSVPTDCLSVW